jgi:hypothetical protein
MALNGTLGACLTRPLEKSDAALYKGGRPTRISK